MLGFTPVASAPIAAAGAAGGTVYLLATEAADAASFSAAVDPALCSLAASEAPDSASIAVNVVASAALAVTEPLDTASGAVSALTIAAVVASETPDAAAFNAVILNDISFALTEAQDTASAAVNVVASVTLLTSEAPDTASAIVYGLWGVIPETPGVWTPQQPGDGSWAQVTPPPVPSNSQTIGLLVSAPLGGSPIAALCVPPVVAPAGAIWQQQQAASQTWSPVSDTATSWQEVPQTYNPQAA